MIQTPLREQFPPGTARGPVTKFLVPDVIFGCGTLREVGGAARRLGGRKVLVISDPGVIEAGWADAATGHLTASGVDHELWAGLTPNPKDVEVEAGLHRYLEAGCDVIVAVGGRSCVDAAKAIAILATHGGAIADYAGADKVRGPLPPTVMVPTTCGAGSDVSQFCVVTDTARRLKVTIGGRGLVPDTSITDPVTLTTLPPDLTAYTALDALSHAIESYVSKAANFLSDRLALDAVAGVVRHLLPALDDPDDLAAREGLARASLQAGLAFTNALLGVTHAISHQIGGASDLPHGLLNAVLLPHVMEFNAPAVGDRFVNVAAALGVETAGLSVAGATGAAVDAVRTLAAKAGVPDRLGGMGLRRSQIDRFAADALNDAYIITNPRSVTEQDVRGICAAAW
jgi:alcohol dehydrogenase class IV